MEVDNLIVTNKTKITNFINTPPDIILLDKAQIYARSETKLDFNKPIPSNYNYITFNLYYYEYLAFNMKIKITDFLPAQYVVYAETYGNTSITPGSDYVISIHPYTSGSTSAISCWQGRQLAGIWYVSAIASVL